MAELKTRPTRKSVTAFIHGIEDPVQRADARTVLGLMKKASGKRPVMWGPAIVGFGSFHYGYASGREGDWPRIGFSPRKGNLSIYIMPGLRRYPHLLKKLGKHKLGVSCLSVRKLEDIHLPTLTRLINAAYEDSAGLDANAKQ